MVKEKIKYIFKFTYNENNVLENRGFLHDKN